MSWLLYGANGYTGRRVARRAVERGERPLLAGRSTERVARLAEELELPWRAVGIDDAAALRDTMDGVDVVAHCAGPFSATSRSMVDACVATGTHYLDITGEIDVFEAIYARHDEAVSAGVVLLPGAGFDVVPTDCVAARLAAALPDATRLDLAFSAPVAVGPGTVKTAIEGAPSGGRVRVDGRLRQEGLAHRQLTARFLSGPRRVSSVPWGDVSSAYRSTGIPNITTYTVIPFGALLGTAHRYAAPLLGLPAVQNAGKALAARVFTGTSQRRPGKRAQIWGEARDGAGARASLTLTTPEAINFTADAVLRAVARLRDADIEPGAHTPSTAFGAGFATTCEGVAPGTVRRL